MGLSVDISRDVGVSVGSVGTSDDDFSGVVSVFDSVGLSVVALTVVGFVGCCVSGSREVGTSVDSLNVSDEDFSVVISVSDFVGISCETSVVAFVKFSVGSGDVSRSVGSIGISDDQFNGVVSTLDSVGFSVSGFVVNGLSVLGSVSFSVDSSGVIDS